MNSLQTTEKKEVVKSSRLSQDEKLAIYKMRFGEGKKFEEIAELTGRHYQTIRNIVKTKEALAFKDAFHESVMGEAVDKMKSNAVVAADAWIDSLHKSMNGEKAQHLHAKEFLTHIKALEVAAPNTDKSTQILIQIGGRESDGGPVVEAEVVEDSE